MYTRGQFALIGKKLPEFNFLHLPAFPIACADATPLRWVESTVREYSYRVQLYTKYMLKKMVQMYLV